MTEKELRVAYENLRPTLTIFANFLYTEVKKCIVSTESFSPEYDLVKLSTPRIKETDSFIGKALFREKKYKNPLEDIEDKVGLRIVCYLENHVEYIRGCLANLKDFKISHARLPISEAFEDPLLFDYQSTHLILTLKNNVTYDGSQIPSGLKSELQLRTVGQDFFAYLTHDTIYKPTVRYVSSKLRRDTAKVMALLEIAQNIAEEAMNSIDNHNENINQLFKYLKESYLREFSENGRCEDEANFVVLNLLSNIAGIDEKGISDIVKDKSLVTRMKGSKHHSYLHKLPVVFLIYFLIKNRGNDLMKYWPFEKQELDEFYLNLNFSPRDY